MDSNNPVRLNESLLDNAHRSHAQVLVDTEQYQRRWCLCPTCGEPVKPDRVHNGIAYVWHFVHCGWGHDGGEPTMTEREAWEASAIDRQRRTTDAHALLAKCVDLYENGYPESEAAAGLMNEVRCTIGMSEKRTQKPDGVPLAVIGQGDFERRINP
jgi:ribosomal protein L37AE/L43A